MKSPATLDRTADTGDGVVRLASCSELDHVVVRTERSMYDLIVLDGAACDVMVRGGRYFPEFRRAILAGSTFGGSAVKLRTICIGLHLEFNAGGKSVVTSRVQDISRVDPRR